MNLTETFHPKESLSVSDQFVEGNTVMVDGTSTKGLDGKYNDYTAEGDAEFEISEDDLSDSTTAKEFPEERLKHLEGFCSRRSQAQIHSRHL